VDGQSQTGIVVIDDRQPDLAQIVDALRPPRGFAGALYRGEQQPDERADDRDHNQQFDEGEPAAAPHPPAIVPHAHGTAPPGEETGKPRPADLHNICRNNLLVS